MEWESQPISPKQQEVLDNFGLDSEAIASKGMASQILDRVMTRRRKLNLASPKQLKWLIRFKHPSPHTATFTEAGLFLDMRFGKSKKVNPVHNAIAESILGPIQWQDARLGYCKCPGDAQHKSPTKADHCRVTLDGVPTIYCFHSSCSCVEPGTGQSQVAVRYRQIRAAS